MSASRSCKVRTKYSQGKLLFTHKVQRWPAQRLIPKKNKEKEEGKKQDGLAQRHSYRISKKYLQGKLLCIYKVKRWPRTKALVSDI
jgi:hypothetical protein